MSRKENYILAIVLAESPADHHFNSTLSWSDHGKKLDIKNKTTTQFAVKIMKMLSRRTRVVGVGVVCWPGFKLNLCLTFDGKHLCFEEGLFCSWRSCPSLPGASVASVYQWKVFAASNKKLAVFKIRTTRVQQLERILSINFYLTHSSPKGPQLKQRDQLKSKLLIRYWFSEDFHYSHFPFPPHHVYLIRALSCVWLTKWLQQPWDPSGSLD